MEKIVFQNSTKYISGNGVTNQIGKELADAGIKSVLLLAGAGSIKNNIGAGGSVYDEVVASLKEAGIAWTEKWGVPANPTLEHARETLAQLKADKAEAILAVGGGSVIDEAKAVACGYYLNDIWDAYEDGSLITQAVPLFVVLTISAAASEANANSVLTHTAKKLKWAIKHDSLRPKVAIVDPRHQSTLPWRQTVNGAVDSLSHIMEFYSTGTVDDEVALAVNEALMRSLIWACDTLQKDSQDYHARANLTWAATMALNGISGAGLSGDWAVHAIEHGISGIFPKVAHAEGLAAITPAWIRYVAQSNPYLFKRWAKNVWGGNTIEEGISLFIAKLKSWGAPTNMNDLNVSEEHFEAIADLAVFKGNPGSVVSLDKTAIIEILELTNQL